MGRAEHDELVALRRASCQRNTHVTLEFQVPQVPGVYRLHLYLVSDSYVGLDQEYSVSITAQLPAASDWGEGREGVPRHGGSSSSRAAVPVPDYGETDAGEWRPSEVEPGGPDHELTG